jgi:hypothetical protein
MSPADGKRGLAKNACEHMKTKGQSLVARLRKNPKMAALISLPPHACETCISYR